MSEMLIKETVERLLERTNPDETVNPEDLVQAIRVLHRAWSTS